MNIFVPHEVKTNVIKLKRLPKNEKWTRCNYQNGKLY